MISKASKIGQILALNPTHFPDRRRQLKLNLLSESAAIVVDFLVMAYDLNVMMPRFLSGSPEERSEK